MQVGQAVRILQDGTEVGTLIYELRKGQDILFADKVLCGDDNSVVAEFPGAELHDELLYTDGLIKIQRHWIVMDPGNWQLTFQYIPAGDLKQWIVPCVMYEENRMGAGNYPRGGVENGWSFREDRTSVPSCSILHNSSQWQAVFINPAITEDEISSTKTYFLNGKPAFNIRIPYCEEPGTYTEKGIIIGGLTGRTEKYFNVRKTPFNYSRTIYIMMDKYVHISEIFINIMKSALLEFKPVKRSEETTDWSRLAKLRFKHLEYLLIDSPGITAIKQGRGNGLFQSFYEYTSGSFLCKSLEAAVIFARVAEETGQTKYFEKAKKIGDFFLKGELHNGLHRDCYSLKSKQWGGYMGVGTPPELASGANARCNGEVMINYLRLYKLLKDKCNSADEFLDVVKNNAGFYIMHQLSGDEEGNFGRWWSTDGVPRNTMGTNGAYIISYLVELEKTTGKREDINNALKKAAKYYASLIDHNGFYADTLDADCVDKEAGCALLRAFLDLYERSHDEFNLKYARLSAGFVLSWMFTYNVPFNANSPLGKRDFKTSGMTAVSVAHHHLDFYGLFIAYDFLRLWEATQDDLWKICAQKMIDACSQLISSEVDLLGRSNQFIGWQPEQVNQTNWDYKTRFMGTKGRFHTCVAWNVVLTLGAMLNIRERYPDMLCFRLSEQCPS